MDRWSFPDVQGYLAAMLPTSTVLLIFVLVFHPLPQGTDDVTKTAIGALLTVGFASIISFYFGSSAGSKSKDNTINKIAEQSAGPIPTPPSTTTTVTTSEAPKTQTTPPPYVSPMPPIDTEHQP